MTNELAQFQNLWCLLHPAENKNRAASFRTLNHSTFKEAALCVNAVPWQQMHTARKWQGFLKKNTPLLWAGLKLHRNAVICIVKICMHECDYVYTKERKMLVVHIYQLYRVGLI